jgi:hypothetical protein
LRFNWVFPAFVRAPIAQIREDWNLELAASQEKIPKNLKKRHVYAVVKKTQAISRCSVALTSCITYSGRGAKKNFTAEKKAVELGIETEYLYGKEIGANLLSNATVYYGSGFIHQSVSCRWSTESNKALFVSTRLVENDAGLANRKLLAELNMSEEFLEGYQAVNEMVLTEQEQVKMIARTSSSSVESAGIAENNRENKAIAIRANLNLDIKSQYLGSDEDAEDDSKKSTGSNASPKENNSSSERNVDAEDKKDDQEEDQEFMNHRRGYQ